MNKDSKASQDPEIRQIVENLTLFDDNLMGVVFNNNIPATQRLLRTILKKKNLKIIRVTGEKELKNPEVKGRNIRLDISARDSTAKEYNIEVQRDNSKAPPQRARFHSSMIDARMLKEGVQFKKLKESYVIFITEKDYYHKGLPLYTADRYIREIDKDFGDGSHIIYVNGSYRGDDPLGRLMHDFSCKNPDDMYYEELADSVRHFKEEGVQNEMCESIDNYVNKRVHEATILTFIETAHDYKDSKENIIQKVCAKFYLPKEKATEYYETYIKDLS